MAAPERDTVIEQIRTTFASVEYPGDAFLTGSEEGCEPGDATAPFVGCTDRMTLSPATLDAHGDALGFFSEAGFRFFLPAYLIADLRRQLATADPLFHLTGGFIESLVELPMAAGVFSKTIGRRAFVNPLRYGAMTFEDYARYRLSVFTREEAGTIVAYLRQRRAADTDGIDRSQIDAALECLWTARAAQAPAALAVQEHLRTEAAYLRTLSTER